MRRGTQITSFYFLYTLLRTHIQIFLLFSISLVASHAWRGCNLYSVVLETGTCVSSSQRTPHMCPYVYSRVGVASVHVCECQLLCSCLIHSTKDIEIRQAIVDNWTGQTVPVSFLGLHSWNPFVSTHHPRLYYQLKEASVALYADYTRGV